MTKLTNILIILVVCITGFYILLARSQRTPITLMEFQQRLKDTGNPRYNPGEADGEWGPRTERASHNWEMDQYALKLEGWEK